MVAAGDSSSATLKCACQGGPGGKNQSLVAAVRGKKFQVPGTVSVS